MVPPSKDNPETLSAPFPNFPEDNRFSSSIPERIAAQVVQNPDLIAVVLGVERLTYRELHSQVLVIAEAICAHAGPENDPVCIFLDKSLYQIIGLLGVLTAGKIAVPLDLSNPDARLDSILDQIEAPLILTDSTQFGRCRSLINDRSAILSIEELRSEKTESYAFSPPAIHPDTLATVLFTSGSTGEPKGVMQTHRNWLHAVYRYANALELKAGDRLFRPGAMAYAAGIRSIFGSLTHGATHVSEGRNDVDNLLQVLTDERVTLLHTPINVLRLLLDSDDTIRQLADLRCVFAAGDALRTEDAKRFLDKFPGDVRLIHALALTECSTIRQCVVDQNLPLAAKYVPVGYPVEDMDILLLDPEHHPITGDATGLVGVRSHFLSPGYWKRPDLTEENFIPDPEGSFKRVYLTGDVGKLDNSGLLIHLGRRDTKLKIRGYQVELNSVTDALLQHPDIRDCAILPVEHGDEFQLVAYIEKGNAAAVSIHSLRSHLGKLLPDYMIPAAFTSIEKIPRNAHGKVIGNQLPVPEIARSELGNEFVSPRNECERQLAEMWSGLLGVDRIGVNDSFLALGGHSLLAARLLTKIAAQRKIRIPLHIFFQNPTVAGLAKEIEGSSELEGYPFNDLIPTRAERPDQVPLSSGQNRIWFLEQMEEQFTAYNISYAWDLEGHVYHEPLRKSLEAVIDRHESLRTNICVVDSEPAQVFTAIEHFNLPVEDFRGLDSQKRESEIDLRIQSDLERPFDLGKELLIRGRLLRLSDDRSLLLITIHHIVFDGWSAQVLWNEISRYYRQYILSEKPSELPRLPIQYADYTIWQKDELKKDKLEHLLRFWRGYLEGLGPLNLTTDRPRPVRFTYRGEQVEFTIPDTITHRLTELSQKHAATLHMTLLSAYKILLARYCRQDDIAIGTLVPGRSQPELENQIGFFVNNLIIRTRLSGNLTFTEVLEQVKQTSLEAYEHQDIPFEKLIELIRPERHLDRSPLVQALFQLQNFDGGNLCLPEVKAVRRPVPARHVFFDLEMHLQQMGGTIHGSLRYCADLFDRPTIERMSEHFQTLLCRVGESPESRFKDIEFLGTSERQKMLTEWNGEITHYPQDLCVHQLFEQQANSFPQKVALRSDGSELSYRELNERANQCASFLRQRGVEPESLIGVCLERSTEMIVSLLAILKAGGAYLPIDPNYPAERVRYMLEDCKCDLLIADYSNTELPGLVDQIDVICIDARSDQREWQNYSRNDAETSGGAENLAYVMYTSGSTGKPKGISITHRNIGRLVRSRQLAFLNSDQTVLNYAPLAFDASTFEIWGSLCNGATLVISPPGRLTVDELGQVISENHVSVLWLTSALFSLFVETDLQLLKPLKYLLAGGDILNAAHVREVLKQLKNTTLINGYGPTEATTFTTFFRMDSDTTFTGSVPIGKPIDNTLVYITDSHQNLQPLGMIGELCIGGEGLGRGYVNRPELTAEKFIPNPFSENTDARIYRTGDLARWLPDGNIEFLGRMDNQVKIRGFRIELGEIESALNDLDIVSSCVVLTNQNQEEDKYLIAYYTSSASSGNHLTDSRAIRKGLSAQLPDYMIPSQLVQMESLPLNPNGKVDRNKLPATVVNGEHTVASDARPTDLLEKKLCEIWQGLFHREYIGVEDNFFDLGGHSLLAVRLSNEVKREIGFHLPVASLFLAPTIRALADAIHEEKKASSWTSLVPIQPKGNRPPFIFTHGWGGDVYHYVNLAKYLSPDQPVYGLQAIDLYEGAEADKSVEEMASRYINEIRSFQSEGPYFLGGYSLGGWIAYEVAQQLHRQGETVEMLALFETTPCCSIPRHLYLRWMAPDLLKRLIRHTTHFFAAPIRDKIKFMRGRIEALRYHLHGRFEQPVNRPKPKPADTPGLDPKRKRNNGLDYYYTVTGRYRPKKYKGSIDLFVTPGADPDTFRVFDHFIRGEVRTHPIPGEHLTILDSEHIERLAKTFENAVRSAQERTK